MTWSPWVYIYVNWIYPVHGSHEKQCDSTQVTTPCCTQQYYQAKTVLLVYFKTVTMLSLRPSRQHEPSVASDISTSTYLKKLQNSAQILYKCSVYCGTIHLFCFISSLVSGRSPVHCRLFSVAIFDNGALRSNRFRSPSKVQIRSVSYEKLGRGKQ